MTGSNPSSQVSLKRDPTFRESNMVLKQRMRALMLRGNRKQQLVQVTKEQQNCLAGILLATK